MKLSLFADESGTMPKRDGDELFVGAAFAIPESSDVDKLPRKRSNLDWTLRLLRQLGARPACLYLRPYPGFGDAVDRRYDLLSAMALVARQRTGVNAMFVGPEGVPTANTVWSVPVNSAVMLAVQDSFHFYDPPPSSVSVYFDAKTLSKESRALVEYKTRNIGASIRDSASKVLQRGDADDYPGFHAMAANALTPDTISIEWEHDSGFSGPPGGMHLVDSLASGARRALLDEGSAPLIARFEKEDYHGVILNVTPMVTERPNGPHIDEWEREHGLIIPR